MERSGTSIYIYLLDISSRVQGRGRAPQRERECSAVQCMHARHEPRFLAACDPGRPCVAFFHSHRSGRGRVDGEYIIICHSVVGGPPSPAWWMGARRGFRALVRRRGRKEKEERGSPGALPTKRLVCSPVCTCRPVRMPIINNKVPEAGAGIHDSPRAWE